MKCEQLEIPALSRGLGASLALRGLVAAGLFALGVPATAAPASIGFNFSDGRDFTHMAGKTADGCTNWADSLTMLNNGYKDANYPGLAYGTATFSSGMITAQWVSATTYSWGSSDNSEQQLYYTYLDDGDGNPVTGDGMGVSVTLSGLSAWLAANQANHYQLRLYCATSWGTSQTTTNTPASIRLGAPNAANGSTQLTSMAVLETVSMQWRGDGGFPTASSGTGSRGYGDSSTNLAADTITITIPSINALGYSTRGSLAGIRITPANSFEAPSAPLPPYGQAVTNALPLAYWRMNELTGATIAADFFGANNGSIGSNVTAGVNGPQFPQFVGFETNNLAMSLNGATNSFLTIPALNLNTNTVTITAWVNPNGIQADSAGIVFCRGGTTVSGLNFQAGGGNELRYTWGSRLGVSTGLIVPSNQWSFVALVVNPSGATLYLGTNGVLNSFTDATNLVSQAFDAPLLLGRDSSGTNRLFNGVLDEVAIYRQALTPAQVQLLYIAATGCPGNPAITSQPTNQTVASGSTATFTVGATGPTVLSYQWQSSTNGGSTFANVTGATNASYTTPVTILPNNGNQYRVVVSGLCGTPVTSSAATLTVTAPPLDGYGQGVVSNAPLAYWRLNEPNGETVAYDFFGLYNGSIAANVTPGVPGPRNPPLPGFSSNNTAMQLSGASGSYLTMPTFNLNTNTVTIAGWLNPHANQPDSDGIIFCRGGTTTAGLSFPGGGSTELRYTWNGSRFDVSTGLIVPTNQWSFFALVVRPTGATLYVGTNGVLNSFTDTVNLPSQAFDAPLLMGFDPSSGSRLYRGGIAAVALYNRSLSSAQIQSLYIAGSGCPGSPSITNQPANQTVITGTSATFSIGAMGPTPLTYQWQNSTNGGTTFVNLTGATNTLYTTPTTSLSDSGTVFRAVVNGLCGIAATSAAATLSVTPPPPLAPYAQSITNSLPIAYWRLNETNGATVAVDLVGGNNGTIGSSVTLGVSGPQNPPFVGFESNNTAMQLNYSTASILTMPTFNLNTNTITVTGWINPIGSQADSAGLVFCRGGNTVAGLNFQSGGGNELRYTWNNDRFGVTTGLVVPTNQWSFFAWVVTPTGSTLYLGTNGLLNSFTDTVALPMQSFAGPLLIGQDSASGGRLYRGRVDEIALYNRSLTPVQIQQLYTSGAGCPGSVLITGQPTNQTVLSGLTASFSVSTTGPTVIGYQWQMSTNSGVTFANINGAVNSTYTTPPTSLGDNGSQFRALVSGVCGATPTSAVASLTVQLGSYPQLVTSDAAFAYWRLNETNGATVAAGFVGSNNGTIGSTVIAGVNGPQNPPFVGFENGNTAMQLNYAATSILTMPTLNLNTNAVTITGWLKPSGVQAAAAGLVFCRGGTTTAGLNFPSGGGNELRYTWNGARYDVSTGLTVPTNQWSFFALVVTPAGATLYLGANGALNSFTDNLSLPSQAFDAPLLVGSDPAGGGRLYNGQIDEIAIFRRSLTLAQIEQLYITAAGCLGNSSITTQPVNQVITTGMTATFSVAATGPTVLSYQWQVSTNSGSSFASIVNATNMSYTTSPAALGDNGTQYRAVASGLCGTPAVSSPATLSVIALSLTAYGQSVTSQSAIAYWRLNEPNGSTVAYDYFGAHNGVIGSGVSAGVAGPTNPPFTGFETNNTAIMLVGTTNSYLTMPHLNLNANTVSILGWVNPTGLQSDSAGLVFCRGGTTIAGVNFQTGSGTELRYTWGSRIGGSTGLVVPTNQWSFFALVVNPSGATLYLGANQILNSVTDTFSPAAQAFDADLLVGYDSFSTGRLFNGRLDEIAVFDQALTPTQIQQFYITGAGCPGGPSVTSSPTNQTVIVGSMTSFSVSATGPTPLSYQWQISTNGGASFSNLAGFTSTTYTTSVLGLADNGTQYRVVVSGLCGPVATSAAATVTVTPPPPLAGYAQSVTNLNPFAYWRMNETNGSVVAYDFFNVYNGSIAANVTPGVSGPRPPQQTGFEADNPAMQFDNSSGSGLTMPALYLNTNTVTITAWINPGGSQIDWAGIVFCRGGTTVAGINFPSGGGTELRYTWNGIRFDVSTGLIVPTNQWSFVALVATANGATLYLGTNGVLNSFTDTVSLPVQSFDASLGIGYDAVNARRFNGRLDEVAIFNQALTVSQLQQLCITGAGCPGSPTITNSPASQTVPSGGTATFFVGATGPTPLSFQWQSSTNGVAFANLSAATNTSYTTPALTSLNNSNQFRAVVSGLCGTPVTSAVAMVTVTPPPTLAAYVQAVTNNSPFAYWRLNEPNGATIAMDYFGVNNGTINAGVIAGIPGPQNPPFTGLETNNTAMRLTGANNSYLTMPVLHLNTNTMTITGWINPTGLEADWAGVVFCRGAQTTAGVNFGPGSSTGLTNELQYTWGGRYGTSTGLSVPTNQWSFVALIVTPTGATVYLGTNGALRSFTDTTVLAPQVFDGPLQLGYDSASGSRLFVGGIDEVAIYSHALSTAQIQQMYLAGAGCSDGPSITNQPANTTACSGATATFQVVVNATTLLNYQWQISLDSGGSFANISGATAPHYTTPTVTMANNGDQYRVIVSDLCGSATTSTVVTLSVQTSAYAQTVAANLPLAFWRLNETNGATVAIDSINSYNGTINPGVTAGVPGPQSPPLTGFESVNTAMQLNGDGNSYLTMPTFNLITNAVTMTGWINPSGIQNDWAAIVFCRSAATAAGLNFNNATSSGFNELRYTWNGSRYDTVTGLGVPTNQWSFFALVISPADATVYLGSNGVLSSYTDPVPPAAQPFDASLLIGRDAFYGRAYKGGIDEVALFNYALSTNQIQQIYNSAAYSAPPPTFESWQLRYFGCTTCPQAAPTADPDGDGQSNYAEFLTGTDPTSAASAFRVLSLTRHGNDIVITWQTAGGRTNAVQVAGDAVTDGFATNFADVSGPIVISGSTDTITNYIDTGATTNSHSRFYRVRLVP